MTTRSWLLYFRANQAPPEEITWHLVERPPAELAAFLIPSLQQFQLGEGASGLSFLELGRQHATVSGNLDLVEALALFIAEEQRHSAMLARYLRLTGTALLKKHWTDNLFRRARKLAGLECMVTVLVICEIMAVPYYRAVYRISACPVLRALCVRILREEAQHLRFQASTLKSLERHRAQWSISLKHVVQKALLLAAAAMLWAQHGRVLREGGQSVGSFWNTCCRLLTQLQRNAGNGQARAPHRKLIGGHGKSQIAQSQKS